MRVVGGGERGRRERARERRRKASTAFAVCLVCAMHFRATDSLSPHSSRKQTLLVLPFYKYGGGRGGKKTYRLLGQVRQLGRFHYKLEMGELLSISVITYLNPFQYSYTFSSEKKNNKKPTIHKKEIGLSSLLKGW